MTLDAAPFPSADYRSSPTATRALIGARRRPRVDVLSGMGRPGRRRRAARDPAAGTTSPRRRWVPGGNYEDGTLIWRSRWVTDHGIVECREAFAYPGSPDRAVILRRVTAVDGDHRVRAVLGPAADYGRRPLLRLATRRAGRGSRTARGSPSAGRGRAAAAMGRRRPNGADLVRARPRGRATCDLVLELAAGSRPDGEPPRPDECWRRTEASWRSVVPACADRVAPRDVRHSIAVLHGTDAASGGTVAAATIRSPSERRPVGTTTTATAGSATPATSAAPARPSTAARRSSTTPSGGSSTACWPTGRRPGRPTRVGGDPIPARRRSTSPAIPAASTSSATGPGTSSSSTSSARPSCCWPRRRPADRLDVEGWQAAEIAVAAIEQRWTEPDAGVWETSPNRWTHSRLICVAGLRAISARRCPGHAGASRPATGRPDRRRHRPDQPAPLGTVAARPRRRSGRRVTAPGRDPRRAPARRSPQPGHPAGHRRRSWTRTGTSTATPTAAGRWARTKAPS